jgi:hypothetical protein
MIRALILLVLAFPAQGQEFQRESHYSDELCATIFNGAPATLPSGLKPDCETAFGIVEFDWAKSPKHYECIGQALVYAAQTRKAAVCALLARTPEEAAFARRHAQEFAYANVKLIVFELFDGN